MLSARSRDVALLLGLGLLAAGLSQASVPWGRLAPRLLEFLAFGTAALATGLLAARLTRRPPAAMTLAAGLVICAIWFVGFGVVAATTLVLAGAMALGTLLPAGGLTPIVRWVAGLGVLASTAGWLLPFPGHRPAIWALGLGLLVLVRRRNVADDLSSVITDVGASMRAAPLAAGSWALVLCIGAAPAWLPAGNADDLAYHLNIGFELLRYGHGRLDMGTQAWALAPWLSDLPHALVTLLAAREGAGPLNSALLVAVGLLIHTLARTLDLSPSRAWLASMLYLSLPLTSFLAGSLQTELVTAPVLAALALAIIGPADSRAERLPLVAALAGLCLGAKVSNALLLLPFAVWFVLAWSREFPWRALPSSVALGIFVAGSSYTYAALLTGNPIVPLFNALFQTPWFPPQNFVDPTWQTGFGPVALWRMVFDTSRYFEGSAGAAGVVLVALAGGVPGALAQARSRPVLLVGLAALLLVFSQVQYVRYLHPAFAVLIPALTAGLLAGRLGRWSWRELLVACVVALQVALLPTSSWKFMEGALRTLALHGPRAVSDAFVPERAISERLRPALLATDRVLFVDPVRSHGAELPGVSIGTAWFTPMIARKTAEGARTPEGWSAVVERAGANHLMVYDRASWPDISAFLTARGARRVDANGAAELFWLPPRPVDSTAIGGSSGGGVVMEISLDRPHPVMGQALVELRCSEPGQPVAVSWTLPASSTPTGHWEWVVCGPSGSLLAAVQFQAGANAGRLHFDAKPAQPGSAMTLEGGRGAIDLRRDFTAETALYRWVRKPFCPASGCGFEKPKLQALPMGWIVRYAEVDRSAPEQAGPGEAEADREKQAATGEGAATYPVAGASQGERRGSREQTAAPSTGVADGE